MIDWILSHLTGIGLVWLFWCGLWLGVRISRIEKSLCGDCYTLWKRRKDNWQ